MSFSLDTTGQSASNFVAAEVHAITPALLANFGYLFLNQGPFFGLNLTITYTPTAAPSTPVVLLLGKDYTFTFSLPGFGNTETSSVWGAIDFFNPNLSGALTISYQALGGNWTFNQNNIATYLNSNFFNGGSQVIQLVPSAPLYLPNIPTAIWPINSIQSIVIAQAQLPNIDLSVIFVTLEAPATLNAQTQPVQVVNLPSITVVKLNPTFTPTPSSGAGTIGTASEDVVLLAANPSRRYLEITNTDTVKSLIVNVLGIAFQSATFIGKTLVPGETLRYDSAVPNTAVHVATEVAGVTYFVVEG